MKRNICILVIVCLLFSGCNTKNGGNSTPTPSKETISSDSLRNLTYLLLSPNEILEDIFYRKIELDPGLVNPTENASKYLNTKHISLNLGVYIADFAYLNLNQNRTNSLDYFKTIRDMAHKINIYSGIDEGIFNRIQDNLANNDSLISITQEMYYNMSDELESSNRQNIYSLIASGALIESVYLSVMNVQDFKDFRDIAQKIFEQRDLFDGFFSFINNYKSDDEVKSIISELDSLREILNNSSVSSEKMIIKKDQNNHLTVKGGRNITVTEISFRKFKSSVIKTREDIVSTR